jgi:hypothetical protein
MLLLFYYLSMNFIVKWQNMSAYRRMKISAHSMIRGIPKYEI